MNLSQNISYLKQIDTHLNDNIYLGITESQALLSDIDSNISSINTNTGTINTNISSINERAESQLTLLGDISTNTSNTVGGINSNTSLLSSIAGHTNSMNTNIDTTLSSVYDNLTDIHLGVSESNQLLSTVDGVLDNILTKQASIDSYLLSIDGYQDAMTSDIDESTGYLQNLNGWTDTMNTNIGTINTNIASIKTDISEMNEINKTLVYERLYWADLGETYQILPIADYSSASALGYYENDSGKTLYVTKYIFSYELNSDAFTPSDQYHSTYVTSTYIGEHLGSGWSISNKLIIHRNREMYGNYSRLAIDGSSTYLHFWKFEFDPPIQISNGNYFAHRVKCNWSSYGTYTTSGMMTGYTLS